MDRAAKIFGLLRKSQLRQHPRRAVHLPQRLDDPLRSDVHRALARIAVDEPVGEALDIAVEQNADYLTPLPAPALELVILLPQA